MTDTNPHPTVRTTAVREDADRVEACHDRGDEIQHRVEWHFDPTERVNFDVPTRRFETRCMHCGTPSIKVRDGEMVVTLFVYADKGAFPRSFRRLDSGITAYNWDDRSWRASTA